MKYYGIPLLLPILLGAVFYLYSPAFGAHFSFDDAPNLEQLRHLDLANPVQVAEFILGGSVNGGIGRPIAFASFVLQAHYWPNDPGAFIYVNTLIHLLNGVLVAWMALRLHRLVPSLAISAEGFSLSLAAVWLLQPLLASASLMVVQRMTTLSASFMLTGLIAYLAGREAISKGNFRGWFAMVASVGLGTGLAVLTKENGALLPLYVWVLEITLLRANKPSRSITSWRFVLAIPGLLLMLYWATHWHQLADSMRSRPFSLDERLLSEARILAEYLLLLFLPVRSKLGPFHDDYIVSHGLFDPPSTLFCVVGWLALTALAIIKRERHPLISFAVLWFLIGHSLESTVFNLELYFEHRNYLPSLGPLILLCSWLWRLPVQQLRLGLVVFCLYLGLEAFVLRELTSMWGKPHVAAHLLASSHPGSERAWQRLAEIHLMDGDASKSQEAIHQGFKQNPHLVGLGMGELQLACYQGKDISTLVTNLMPSLKQGDRSYAALVALKNMIDKLEDKPCPGLRAEVVQQMIDTLLSNIKFRTDPLALSELYRLKARFYLNDRQLDPLIRTLEMAFEARPDIETAMLIIGYLDSAGLYDMALEKSTYFRSRMPVNPVARYSWSRRLDEIEPALRLLAERSKTEKSLDQSNSTDKSHVQK